jgi:hypothetical protein
VDSWQPEAEVMVVAKVVAKVEVVMEVEPPLPAQVQLQAPARQLDGWQPAADVVAKAEVVTEAEAVIEAVVAEAERWRWWRLHKAQKPYQGQLLKEFMYHRLFVGCSLTHGSPREPYRKGNTSCRASHGHSAPYFCGHCRRRPSGGCRSCSGAACQLILLGTLRC